MGAHRGAWGDGAGSAAPVVAPEQDQRGQEGQRDPDLEDQVEGAGAAAGDHPPSLGAAGPPELLGVRASVGDVRLQEFWSRLGEHFGPMRAESVARDHVFSALGGYGLVALVSAALVVPLVVVWARTGQRGGAVAGQRPR